MIPPAAFPLSLCHPCSCRTPAPNMGDYTSPYCASGKKKKPKTIPIKLIRRQLAARKPPRPLFTHGLWRRCCCCLFVVPPRHSLRYRPVTVVTESSPHDQKCCRDLRVLKCNEGADVLGDTDLLKKDEDIKKDEDTICRVRMRYSWENIYTSPQPCVKIAP